jgi:hypothetical protein
MCLICRLGRQKNEPYYFEDKLDAIKTAIAKNRDCVIKLRCNVESTFCFQNPGDSLDTPEAKSFNLRRDLTVLQRLGLMPGAEIPASDLIRFITRNGILTCSDICAFPAVTAPEWKGCRYGTSGNYERGVNVALAELIPARTLAERECCKQETAAAMYKRKLIKISPHHLLCMACFVGKSKADEYSPILEDNLYEAIETCRQHPDTIIELIPGTCMICPPCNGYYPDTGFCSMGFAMGLRSQKKDLDTLQFIGLDYGVKMRADKLFKLLFERIKDKKDICGFNTNIQTHAAWSICPGLIGEDGFQNYRDASENNLGMEKLKESQTQHSQH